MADSSSLISQTGSLDGSMRDYRLPIPTTDANAGKPTMAPPRPQVITGSGETIISTTRHTAPIPSGTQSGTLPSAGATTPRPVPTRIS